MVVPLRRIFASLVVLFCSLGLGSTAFADGPTVYKGRWRVHLTKRGVNIHGGGPIKIRVFPEGGIFTCIVHGGGSVGGSLKQGKARVDIEGGFSFAGQECSGTFAPATGQLRGKGELRNKMNATLTAHSGKGDKPMKKTQRSNKLEPFDITGSLSGGCGKSEPAAPSSGLAAEAPAGRVETGAPAAAGAAPVGASPARVPALDDVDPTLPPLE